MPEHYTTGEIAKLCGVTVRTVQYYDTRGLLVPSELSEGGRRLYTSRDVRKLQVICFLREIGMKVSTVGELMQEEDPGSVIELLLMQQESELQAELREREEKLENVRALLRNVRTAEKVSLESIADMANCMKNRKKLYRMYATLLITGLPLSALQIAAIILGVTKGNWWLLLLWAALAIPYAVWMSRYYLGSVAYICPACHEVFKPSFRDAFWAAHTPRTRKLTCPHCGHKGYCVEVWDEKKKKA